MNQTQRKHIQTRLTAIHNEKRTAIHTAFSRDPKNIAKHRGYPSYPTPAELMLKIAGFESKAQLLYTGAELERMIIQNPNMPVNVFLKPTNSAALEVTDTHNREVEQRRRVEVDSKCVQLKHNYDRLMDTLILSNDADYITSQIAAFEQLEV